MVFNYLPLVLQLMTTEISKKRTSVLRQRKRMSDGLALTGKPIDLQPTYCA